MNAPTNAALLEFALAHRGGGGQRNPSAFSRRARRRGQGRREGLRSRHRRRSCGRSGHPRGDRARLSGPRHSRRGARHAARRLEVHVGDRPDRRHPQLHPRPDALGDADRAQRRRRRRSSASRTSRTSANRSWRRQAAARSGGAAASGGTLKTRRCPRLCRRGRRLHRSQDVPSPPASASAFDRVVDRARLTRWGGDCYAYCLLAMGLIDIVIEASLHAYDVQALMPIIERGRRRDHDVDGRARATRAATSSRAAIRRCTPKSSRSWRPRPADSGRGACRAGGLRKRVPWPVVRCRARDFALRIDLRTRRGAAYPHFPRGGPRRVTFRAVPAIRFISAHSARILAAAPTCRWRVPFRRGSCRQGRADARAGFAGAEGCRDGGLGARTGQGPRLPAARGARIPGRRRKCGHISIELLGGEGHRRFPEPSRSSTRSSRRRPSSCAGRSAATSTASRSPPNGSRRVAAAAAAPGRQSPAAASRSRWAGSSSRARAFSPGCRSRSASPSFARSRPKASRTSRSSGRTTSSTAT